MPPSEHCYPTETNRPPQDCGGRGPDTICALFPADLPFFVLRVLPAPAAILQIFYLPFHFFLVLRGVIIAPLADIAPEDDKPIRSFYFGHVSTGTL